MKYTAVAAPVCFRRDRSRLRGIRRLGMHHAFSTAAGSISFWGRRKKSKWMMKGKKGGGGRRKNQPASVHHARDAAAATGDFPMTI